jgi:foldase protein PrsA
MIKKLLIFTVVFAALLALLAGCGSLPKSAVAEVNGKVITREDLDRAMEDLSAQYQGQGFPEQETDEYKNLQKSVAERLVNEEILWFEADKLGITVSDDEINQQLDTIKQQSGGDEQFKQQMEQRNYTEDRLKDQIRKSLIFQKLYPEVTKEAVEVTDEQAQKYYADNQALFAKPETRAVRHILVADEAAAAAVIARLGAGEDFATVAKEVSTDPGSKDKGGDLGEVPTTGSGFVPEFEQAMNQLAVGQTSAPVKSSFGFHIIQVTAVKPAGTQTFDEVKEELKQGLVMENQRTAFESWFNGVKGNYDVEYAEEFKPAETTPAETTTGAADTGATTTGTATSTTDAAAAAPVAP